MKRSLVQYFILTLTFSLVSPSFVHADGAIDGDSFDQIMKLRLEVEEKNTLWEQEKKRLQAEYDTLVIRKEEVQAEVLRKRSQLGILEARGASQVKRSERRQTVSGKDRGNLIDAVSEFKAVSDQLIPIGRTETREKLRRISEDLLHGRGSVDEVAVDFAQLLKSELKLARGVHLVKEQIQVEGETVSVEAALIGGYTAIFAAADGRVGKWNVNEKRTQWVGDEREKSRTLAALETVRKTANGSRPVILEFDLEAK